MESQNYATEVDVDIGERNKRKNVEKEALMRVIAQEMVSSLLGENDAGEDDDIILQHMQEKLLAREKLRSARRKARRKSSKSVRTRHQEGELSSPIPNSVGAAGSYVSASESAAHFATSSASKFHGPVHEIEISVRDDDSFAGGDLDELVDSKYRRTSLASSSSEGTSAASGSMADNGTKSTVSDSKDTTLRSRELSIEEIRQYVLDNIPPAVREQIPQEAWGQIFRGESTKGSKTTSQRSRASSGKPRKNQTVAPINEIVVNNDDDDIDEITVFSEVSGLTGAFPDGKGVEQRRESLGAASSGLPKVNETSSQASKHGSEHSASVQSSQRAPMAPGEITVDVPNPRDDHRDKIGVSVSSPQHLRSQRKRVSWHQVEVRYYERIVTDNPAVQSGPAIGIGWRYKRGGRVDVDYWEQSRGQPRQSAELVLPRYARERMLRDAGIPNKDVADMVRATLKTKNQRLQTINNLPMANFEEAVETAGRRLGRLLTLGRSRGILRR